VGEVDKGESRTSGEGNIAGLKLGALDETIPCGFGLRYIREEYIGLMGKETRSCRERATHLISHEMQRHRGKTNLNMQR
jgi:hypothetical protein